MTQDTRQPPLGPTTGSQKRRGHQTISLLDQWSQMQLPRKLIRFARRSPREQLQILQIAPAIIRCQLEDWGWRVPHLGNDRTAYVIGLFGSGRFYVNGVMEQNIGERAKYIRDRIRLHPGPTSMIYSGHATSRHVSRDQALPAVTSCIFEAVRSGFADLIFVYRHPLDALITNWIYWRIFLREDRGTFVSQEYENTDDLCAVLERNFSEFKAFAEGDPGFFAAAPGPRFLSFPEYVEETELFLQSARLALRLEDFMIDPSGEFSKIAKVMSIDLDLSRLHIAPPRTKPYRYLAVKEKVPRFRDFINGLDPETRRRSEKIGYEVCG